MQIVDERILAPRPVQRPSDIERRPSDFGIESPPPPPPKPESTIIKSALGSDDDFKPDQKIDEPSENKPAPEKEGPPDEEDWNFDNL